MTEKNGPAHFEDRRVMESRVDGDGQDPRGNWMEAIIGLFETRAAIVSLEAKDALSSALAKLVPLVLCLFCVFAAWALTVAAIIGCLTGATDWKWHQITFAMAGVHILIAAVALLVAKAKKPAPFPVTRSEFEKDREWLIQLKNRNN
jgi:uncharacterized membrane protein YqjE